MTFLASRRALFAGILFLGLLAMTARPATDPDLWWHLRTGQWIVQTGHVPHTDPFSFTRVGHAWVAHEWLSEVVFYELWKHGGAAALIVFSALITTLGFMLLYMRCPPREGKRHWAVAATALGALAADPDDGDALATAARARARRACTAVSSPSTLGAAASAWRR